MFELQHRGQQSRYGAGSDYTKQTGAVLTAKQGYGKLIPGMALRKHNLLTCAVAAAVAFEKLSRTP
jgi:hypothetical protein